ncbi:tetraacyldisaccharide 4'-kinase [uncultured Algibacter sp.]|uniref:tetraacyldisaccharide 4'-kinase n=1 Tax=uncultured Algibacter sp. TaxID=298659 RepID=UPI00262D9FD9|nr:tetraacyldisaccharide 4'-kinase [uncultured Algibacter sp.]
MKIVRYILFPIVPVYFLVTWLRNKLYDAGIKASKSYNFPVVCVGNLSVGGTGKTPMIEYLINLLKDEYKLATLSRGYKRKTKGFVLANEVSSVDSIGDEPFQFYSKFKGNVLVAVDSNRQHGIKCLQDSEPDLILLDDAFQHRKVKAGLNILLTTYNKPYYKDIVLPTGDLREPRSGADRANIIVVTKCPNNLSDTDKSEIVKCIKPKNFQSVFFSSIAYSERLFSVKETKLLSEIADFTLVTGIANASPLLQFLKKKQLKFEHLNFKDHHHFSRKDIDALKNKDLILTTEKDFVRLKQYDIIKDKLFYLPITVSMDGALGFNQKIKDFIKH